MSKGIRNDSLGIPGGYVKAVMNALKMPPRLLRNKLRGIFVGSGRGDENRGELLSRLLLRTRDLDLAQRVLETNRFRKGIRPELLAHPHGRRLLVLAPHQDDEIIGCGGVFLHAVASGREVKTVYLTDGAAPRLHGEERTRYSGVRRDEAERVWQALGGSPPTFWDLPCQRTPVDEQTAGRVAHAIEEFQPDALFVPFFLEDPDDHRKISHLLWLASKQHDLPEIEVWSYQITVMIAPNVAVDISDVEARKHELMQMWESQNGSFDYAHRARGLNAANALYVQGVLQGNPRPYVELFFVLPMREYINLVGSYFSDAPSEQLYAKFG